MVSLQEKALEAGAEPSAGDNILQAEEDSPVGDVQDLEKGPVLKRGKWQADEIQTIPHK